MLYGIGVDISAAKTMEEAIELSGLNWLVETKKLSVDEKVIPGYRANVTSDGKVLGIVTKQYQIVQNIEAFTFADNIVDQIKFDTAGSLYGDKKIWVSSKFNDINAAGEKIENYLVFSNSHDGKSSIRVAIIPIINGNAMNIPLAGTYRSWSVTHSGNINKKMDQAKETLVFAENYLAELVKQTQKMVETKLTEKQKKAFVEQLFPINPQDGDRKIDNVNECRVQVMEAINKIESHVDTAWQVINGVSAFVTNMQPKRSSDTFFDNKFGSIIVGNQLIDKAYKILKIKYVK